MSAQDPDTLERDRVAKLESFDEALKGGIATSTDPDPALCRAQECLRLLEQFWPRHPNNAPTNLKDAPGSSESKASESVGRFRIVRELGRGGFGIVYLAHDPELKRDVALKVPRADALNSPELRQRFQREARAAAGFDHPNLVPVYETGADGSVGYIVSAYCPGVNLAEWLRGQTEPVPVADAAQLVSTLARAVQHAHERGVLHRDLKPANILLQAVDREAMAGDDRATATSLPLGRLSAKITDFGLAKLADADLQTHTGATMGTPSYMAPEQSVHHGPPAGPAADVYSLGVILYELLTGRPPFVTGSPLETLLLVQNEVPIPPSRLRHRLPRDLETICLKCLEKEPARRYVSAGDLAADLDRFLAGKPIHARPLGPVGRSMRWARRKPIEATLLALFVIALAAGVGGIGWQWWRAETNARRAGQDRDIAVAQREQSERILEQTKVALDRLTNLADRLIDKPETDKTGRDVLEEVLSVYQAILKERSTDPTVRFRTAGASFKVATVYLHMRRWEECDAAFARSFEILDELRKEDPAHLQYRWLLCQCLVWHGHSLRDRSKHKEAIESYVRAIEVSGRVLEEVPNHKGFASLRANALLNCCGPLRNEQRWDEARRFQEESLNIQRKLAAGSAPNSGYRGELALGLDGFAMTLLGQGRAKDAEPLCREALAIREEIHGHGLKIEGGVRYLARSYTSLGRILDALDRVSEAEQAHQQAIQLLRKLTAEFPNDPLFKDALVNAMLWLGDLHANHGSAGAALAVYSEALAVPPQTPGTRNDVAYHLVASSDPRARDPRTALPLALGAVKQSPGSGNLWNTLGVVYYRLGDWGQTIEAMKQAIALRGEYPGDLLFMAMAHAQQSDWPHARESLERARVRLQKYPDNVELLRFRAEAEELLSKSAR